MAGKGMRTASGSPSAKARKQTGGGGGLKKGSYPVFDTKSGVDALELRGHASNPAAVEAKVQAFGQRTHNQILLNDVRKPARPTNSSAFPPVRCRRPTRPRRPRSMRNTHQAVQIRPRHVEGRDRQIRSARG